MILYREKPWKLHIKTTRTDKEFIKVVGCKINIQKCIAFLCTNNEISERENTKKKSLLKLHQKVKYLGRNQTKMVKDLYADKGN